MNKYRAITRWIWAFAMMSSGTYHFLRPDIFEPMLPGILQKNALLWVWLSGYFEILGGMCLLIPSLRWAAGWGLICLYLAVFPANLYVAISAEPTSSVWLWLRLPLQLLFMWVAWWIVQPSQSRKFHPWDNRNHDPI